MSSLSKPVDRRKERRVVHRAVVILVYGLYEKMEFEEAELVDCSSQGVCIELKRPLEISSAFLLKSSSGGDVMLRYNVRRCDQLNGSFNIGAEYSGFVSTKQMTLEPPAVLEMLLLL
jgi:hypothetical protein